MNETWYDPNSTPWLDLNASPQDLKNAKSVEVTVRQLYITNHGLRIMGYARASYYRKFKKWLTPEGKQPFKNSWIDGWRYE